MQILPHGAAAGARGRLWRVVRREPSARDAAHLLRLEHDDVSGGGRLVAVRPFEPVSKLESTDTLHVCSPRDAANAVSAAIARTRPAFALRMARALNGDIHSWQLRAALAFERGHSRVLVADDVGMGKTVTAAIAIAECLEEAADRRCLVMAPAHLLPQWIAELEARAGVRAAIAGAGPLRRIQRARPAGVSLWALPGCVLTSIDYVKQAHVLREIRSRVWDMVVIDEAHIACGDSDRHAAADAIARTARRLLLLTATPADGAGDRVRALRALGGGDGSPIIVLRERRRGRDMPMRWLTVKASAGALALQSALRAYAQWIASGSNAAGARLLTSVLTRRAISSPHALHLSLTRRLSLLQAPDTHQPSFFDDLDDPAILGVRLGLPAGDERTKIEALRSMAASVVDERIHALRRLLRRTRDSAIVFTCFRDTALVLADALRDSTRALLLHGELPPAVIHETLRRFTSATTPAVLVATDMASQGLNLHAACRWVIHFDLPWRPAAVRQRNGRVDRLGQTRRPHATALIDDTPLAQAELRKFQALHAEMTREESDDAGRRWAVLGDAEAARLRQWRDCGSAQPATRPRLPVTIVEIETLDNGGSPIERELLLARTGVSSAMAGAAAQGRRRAARLRVHLAARARRRTAREHSAAGAAMRAVAPLLQQDGLFERRAERARGTDAAARDDVARQAAAAVAGHKDASQAGAARVRVIASFTAAVKP